MPFKSHEIREFYNNELSDMEYLREQPNDDTQQVIVSSPSLHQHHTIPQEFDDASKFKDYAESFGIDIHDYIVDLDADYHLKEIHNSNRIDWNGEWRDFFERMMKDENINTFEAARNAILEQAINMVEQNELSEFYSHPFNESDPHLDSNGEKMTILEKLESDMAESPMQEPSISESPTTLDPSELDPFDLENGADLATDTSVSDTSVSDASVSEGACDSGDAGTSAASDGGGSGDGGGD